MSYEIETHEESLCDLDDDSPVFRMDEFRMFCFKVLPCTKKYSHDWTACPFAHQSEKAQRRDPRRHAGITCPSMKTTLQCPRGDTCKFAHNDFEYWLHPSRYRTQLCKDGMRCKRKVCFFAHTLEEMRDRSSRAVMLPEGETLGFRQVQRYSEASGLPPDARQAFSAPDLGGAGGSLEASLALQFQHQQQQQQQQQQPWLAAALPMPMMPPSSEQADLRQQVEAAEMRVQQEQRLIASLMDQMHVSAAGGAGGAGFEAGSYPIQQQQQQHDGYHALVPAQMYEDGPAYSAMQRARASYQGERGQQQRLVQQQMMQLGDAGGGNSGGGGGGGALYYGLQRGESMPVWVPGTGGPRPAALHLLLDHLPGEMLGHLQHQLQHAGLGGAAAAAFQRARTLSDTPLTAGWTHPQPQRSPSQPFLLPGNGDGASAAAPAPPRRLPSRNAFAVAANEPWPRTQQLQQQQQVPAPLNGMATAFRPMALPNSASLIAPFCEPFVSFPPVQSL